MQQPVFSPSKTLDAARWGQAVKNILSAALIAVDPAQAVAAHLQRRGHRLSINGRTYALDRIRRLLVVGAGKAGAPMAAQTAVILGDDLTAGLVIVKEGYGAPPQTISDRLQLIEAGHPLPDERGVEGAQRMAALLADCTADDLVICLISGGGSALLTAPVSGVSLADMQALTSMLLASGASINEINTLRKHLEQLKGGGLARFVFPAQIATLILSDVIGDPLDMIASGPTAPDRTTFQDAWAVLQRYHLTDRVPASVREHLERGLRGQEAETPKPGDAVFQRVQNLIIGNNYQAAVAAMQQAKREGFNILLLTTFLQGEARQAGRFLAAVLRQAATTGQPIGRPACIIAGGETTVTLTGDGLGGRNQELALAAIPDLAGLPDIALITLATDGGDGPTDAAGAVVTGETQARASQAGLNVADYLQRNDSYHFFQQLNDLLRTGPTRTNVNDLTFLFAF